MCPEKGWGLSSEYHQHKHRLGQTDDTFVNKDRSESDEGGVGFFVFRFGYFEWLFICQQTESGRRIDMGLSRIFVLRHLIIVPWFEF